MLLWVLLGGCYGVAQVVAMVLLGGCNDVALALLGGC